MSFPDYAVPFVTEVWRACDPVAVTSGRYYNADFGLPPKTLHIYQVADADWERGHCKRLGLRGWLYDGSSFNEILPATYPDFSERPTGIFWHTGLVEFCVDTENRRAVYDFVLGPRYGRGYKRTFAPDEPIRLESDGRFLVWAS